LDSKKERNDKRYKVVPILISLVILLISFINLYLSYPVPNLEVGMFPEKGIVWSNSVIASPTTDPSGQPYYIITYDNSTACSIFNFTFQVYNTGKGIARNVNVSIVGEPADTYTVISTYVFVSEPLESNLLDVVSNRYKIGLLGSGKSYSFLFVVRVAAESKSGKFVIKVESENAGTQIHNIVFGE
jgi:hypothetical protein